MQNENKRKMNQHRAIGFSDQLDGRREKGKKVNITSKLRSRDQKKQGSQETWTGPRAVIKDGMA